VDGRLVDEWPLNVAQLERAVPVYETFPGWSEDLGACRSIEQLPPAARRYLDAIEARAGVPINIVSLGPERTQTIVHEATPAMAAAG
jgi:adenylosuccinate synthase